MVVVLKLDDPDAAAVDPGDAKVLGGGGIGALALADGQQPVQHTSNPPSTTPAAPSGGDAAAAPSRNGFSAILACYPIAVELASFLDQNTLHALSRTTKLVRAQLLLHRRQLLGRTLRCSNEAFNAPDAERNGSASSRYQSWDVAGSYGVSPLRVTSGKVGPCARDMVGECRRCGRVVCRVCGRAPLAVLLRGSHGGGGSANGPGSCQSHGHGSSSSNSNHPHGRSNGGANHAPNTPSTSDSDPPPPPPPPGMSASLSALTRQSCTCASEVFICQACGHAISSADVNYRRIWEWRTRYSTYLGGLGTGIGEGTEGVQCARATACLAAKQIEVEVDGRSADLASLDWVPLTEADAGGPAASPGGSDDNNSSSSGRGGGGGGGGGGSEDEGDRGGYTTVLLEGIVEATGEKAGYMRQEIEGIGGVVRTKFKKRLRVGLTVEEHEDERATAAPHLGREARGQARCWCGWCNRVVLDRRDESTVAAAAAGTG